MDRGATSHYLRRVSSLFLIRHAQASIHAEDYDNLSAHGVQQSQRLGDALASRGMRFDAVYVGPKRRHRQTYDHARTAAADKGLELPDAVEREALTEIDAQLLGAEAMRRVEPSCPDLRERLSRGELDDEVRTGLRHYMGVFEVLMKRWAKGEFDDRLLPYHDFSSQVVAGMQSIMREQGRKKNVLVVTSGGPISMFSRLALGATPDKAVELMFALNNASVTELRYTENRLTLVRFNDAGYLPANMLTGI